MMKCSINEVDANFGHGSRHKNTHHSIWLVAFTCVIYQIPSISGAFVGLAGSSPPSALWLLHSATSGATSRPSVRCLPEWRRHRRGCYRSLLLAPVQYDEAREKCHQLDPAADLPVLSNLEDAAFVQGLVPRTEWPSAVFLGATDRQREGQFRWHDGSPVTLALQAWATDEPTNSSRQNCLLLITQVDEGTGRGRFSVGDSSCQTYARVVVCQMPFPVLALPVRPEDSNPPNDVEITKPSETNTSGCNHPGSVRFGGSCYLYQDEYLPQRDAGRLCRQRGYRLASIQSQPENDLIQNMILDVSWLGGRLRGLQWRWPGGQPLLFTRWAAASLYFRQQPDGGGREHCLNMLSSVRSGWVGEKQASGDGYWADNDCSLRWPSVCETLSAD